ARRLQVYRNNHASSLTEALRAVYPVLHRLVGDEFFMHLAVSYVNAHPSRCGNLHGFGAQVPEFVAGFPGLEVLPYVRDVASLEWSYHEVFHAADHAPLDVARLAVIAPPRYGELKFSMHPASRLLESPYPVLRIWQANQPDDGGDGVVDLHSGANRLLVIRRALDVEFELLDRGDYAFLSALRD
ncbi:MAG: putative DNA-binding domain-containing protein, partial [Gammaproteobacteria bacterium]|nr:putative DNA-binding domain-containing protein [Gammaproteobacteria bacterium]